MSIVFGSVCSGIEAASTAWHPLGWRAAFLSEIEAFPRAVLRHHYPETPLHGDFTTIQAGEYEPIDLLVGGTPCQSFSVAGLRGGLDDDRGNLALEYLRLADRLRPRWLVWENVPGVLSSAGGRDFGSILGGLVELGYGFAYRVLDAQFFGVAQRRRRVFVVGYLGDWRRAAAVLFERHSLSGHPAPRRETGEGAAQTIAGGARRSGGYSEDDIPHVAHCLNAHGGAGRMDGESETFVAGIAPTLKADTPWGDQKGHEDLLIAHTLKGEGFDASEDGTGRGTPIVPVSFTGGASECITLENMAHPVTGRHGDPGMIAFALRGREGGAMPEVGGDQIGALRSASGGSSRDYVAFTQNSRSEVRQIGGDGSIVGALAADAGAQQQNYIAGSAVRRLTPRECERLQGFPDDYTLIPWRKGMAPDGPRYKALGNSMAVPVMAWIGRRIAAVEAVQAQSQAA